MQHTFIYNAIKSHKKLSKPTHMKSL